MDTSLYIINTNQKEHSEQNSVRCVYHWDCCQIARVQREPVISPNAEVTGNFHKHSIWPFQYSKRPIRRTHFPVMVVIITQVATWYLSWLKMASYSYSWYSFWAIANIFSFCYSILPCHRSYLYLTERSRPDLWSTLHFCLSCWRFNNAYPSQAMLIWKQTQPAS